MEEDYFDMETFKKSLPQPVPKTSVWDRLENGNYSMQSLRINLIHLTAKNVGKDMSHVLKYQRFLSN